ncbi:MAG: CarD family transcriptional regulator [Blastocatellia bacterium]
MKLAAGNKVVYPSLGPCLIGPVIEKTVSNSQISFYHLELLDDSGGTLLVPVNKVEEIGIRLLLKRSDIPKLLGKLRLTAIPTKDWKQRANDNLKRLTSGSAFDLAEIVESLSELKKVKSLSFRENWTLERAKKLLICEISEVMGETRNFAEKKVDQALSAERKERKLPRALPTGLHAA